MSFRKRNVVLSRASEGALSSSDRKQGSSGLLPGLRPSPIDGRLVTSTGTPSLDAIMAGHSGLAMGNLLLVEESGTTDYAGSLLRYYGAEGIVQGHHLHLIGLEERWTRDLPGVVGAADEQGPAQAPQIQDKDRMKIAWRYEGLAKVDGEAGVRGSTTPNRVSPAVGSRTSAVPLSPAATPDPAPFCHVFDLTKRLEFPSSTSITRYSLATDPASSPFEEVKAQLVSNLSNSPPNSVHRILFAGVLSPAVYSPHTAQPQYLLPMMHLLRSLCRRYPDRLTGMLTLPISLHPRSTALVCWTEHLVDGVIEMTPFPHRFDDHSSFSASGKAGSTNSQDEQPQGIMKIHKLPVYHERGGGGGANDLGNDLAFTVSRRKFVVRPYSLPPADGDTEAQREAGSLTKDKIDF